LSKNRAKRKVSIDEVPDKVPDKGFEEGSHALVSPTVRGPQARLTADKTHTRMILHICRVAAVLALVFTAGCCGGPGQQNAPWQTKLQQELPVLGHRNWIVIADAAYPAQNSPGIQTIYTGAHQLEAIKALLAALQDAKHVQPNIYLDAELQHVKESAAPGVDEFRTQLDKLFVGRTINRLPHEKLIARLDEAGKTFRILILKTDLTIPYTSVFFELDCGYWSPSQETELRKSM
jgi:L-fucose mutarotase/ribose pyranase (RbsD/FucU family)